MDTSTVPDRRRPAWSVRVHAGIVGVLLALFAALWLAQPPGSCCGANIGAGIALLPVLALGAPWTIPYLADPYAFDAVPDLVHHLITLGPAVLNVVLHGLAVRWWRRRVTGAAAPGTRRR